MTTEHDYEELRKGTLVDMKERTVEGVALYVGRLGDLGLGNPEGIPSDIADMDNEEMRGYANELAAQLTEIEDREDLSCIDGRNVLQNTDGSPAATRMRRVGGSASNLEVAHNSDASIVDTCLDKPMNEQINIIDTAIESGTGFKRSAHEGGCGGAIGAKEDNENIATNPKIIEGVKALMEIPEVRIATGVDFEPSLADEVASNAKRTAAFLEASGWDGRKYVEGVRKDNPYGDEDLAVDHDDHRFHGHNERAIVVVLGDKTLPVGVTDVFVWNIEASIQVANSLAGQRGKAGYTQALIAEFAKHIAVCDRLPSKKTPLLVIG